MNCTGIRLYLVLDDIITYIGRKRKELTPKKVKLMSDFIKIARSNINIKKSNLFLQAYNGQLETEIQKATSFIINYFSINKQKLFL